MSLRTRSSLPVCLLLAGCGGPADFRDTSEPLPPWTGTTGAGGLTGELPGDTDTAPGSTGPDTTGADATGLDPSGGGVTAGSTGDPSATGCESVDWVWCDDFESGLDPSYVPWIIGEGTVAVDGTRAHSGTGSLRATGLGFTTMLGIPVPGPVFHGRVYLTSDTPMNEGHNTYIAAGEGTGDPNTGEWIRIGEHRQQLEINRRSDDAELLSSGDYNSLEGAVQLQPDVWYCLEFRYDGPGREVQIWVDGVEVESLHATDWGADYATFKLGYERYHGPDKTLWYDDLALDVDRVGC